MLDRRYFIYFDWISLAIVILLSIVGLLMVFSATYKPEIAFSIFYKKQLFGVLLGFFIYFICCFIDYRTFERTGYLLYFVTMFLLGFTLLFGGISMGGQRWINLWLFKFQPSEIAKILFAPFFSYQLEEKEKYKLKDFLFILAMLAINILLILKQPDLGTAIIILISGFILLWLAGINKKFIIIVSIVFLALAPIGWKFLKPYQRQRIAVFWGGGSRQKERYQIEQSVIAIGSGGAFGKGFLKGTQNKLRFLPEGRTDFIFSVVCEEWGFAGAIFILFLFFLLFYRILSMIISLKHFHTRLLGIGLILPLIISVLINVGMVVGLLPTVGIPLPFITYGISHLWMSFISLGVIQSIAMRRFSVSIS